MIKQELETPSSSELYSSPEPETKREHGYGSPYGLEATIHAAETKRVSDFAAKSRSVNKNIKVLIGRESMKSKLPIVDLSAFKEFKELMKQYSDLALASQYKAYDHEIGFLVECGNDITGEDIERVCDLAQEKVQSHYEMYNIKWNGITQSSKLVYFRMTPAKKMFLSFNVPQVKAIAYRNCSALKNDVNYNSHEFEEIFRQFYLSEKPKGFYDPIRIAYEVDPDCKGVCSAILSKLESQVLPRSRSRSRHPKNDLDRIDHRSLCEISDLDQLILDRSSNSMTYAI